MITVKTETDAKGKIRGEQHRYNNLGGMARDDDDDDAGNVARRCHKVNADGDFDDDYGDAVLTAMTIKKMSLMTIIRTEGLFLFLDSFLVS